MRFILVAVIWLLCVGGVAGYLRYRDAGRESGGGATEVPLSASQTRYDVELTLTFRPEPDPFALYTEPSGPPPPVSIRLNGSAVIGPGRDIEPGRPWLKEGIEGIVQGTNEFLIEASPPIEDVPRRQAARLRLFGNGRVLADETFWSEGGSRVIGIVRFTALPKEDEARHDN